MTQLDVYCLQLDPIIWTYVIQTAPRFRGFNYDNYHLKASNKDVQQGFW